MLKSWIQLAKMRVKEYFSYPSNFFLFTFNRIVEVVVYIFVWFAIYQQTGEIDGYSMEEIYTYYILVVSLISIALWGINEDIAYSIRKGQINKELLNPISYFHYCFGVELGEVGFGVLTSIATFIICAIFWKVLLPVSLLHFVLFLLVVLLIIPIGFFIDMIVGLCGFYTNSIWGMQILRNSIISIFSGLIAPLTMFPGWFQKIANVLPFKEFIYTPIQIYLGRMPVTEILFVIGKQLCWIVILYILARLFFQKAVKNITINGG